MTVRFHTSLFATSALGLVQTVMLFLQPATSSRAAVSLTNGSFETIGPEYNAALGGLNEASGWTNLTSFQIQACSAVASNPPNAEFTGGTPTGTRYLRLVSDLNNDPGFQGAIAQSTGSMVTGETYTIMADIFGGPGAGVTYGATISFVNEVSATPSFTYATQTLDGLGDGAFMADGFNLSYTATLADNGQPLVLLLLAKPNFSGATANRGGLDNLRLTTVPEPSAVLLAALAGAGLYRRRRS